MDFTNLVYLSQIYVQVFIVLKKFCNLTFSQIHSAHWKMKSEKATNRANDLLMSATALEPGF